MSCALYKRVIFGFFYLSFLSASLLFTGGAFFVQGAYAQTSPPLAYLEAPIPPLVHLQTDEHFRYISSNGIPNHVTQISPAALRPRAYVFRMNLKPVRAKAVTPVPPTMFYGVALNGIPFDSQGKDALTQNGNFVYHGLPAPLVTKDFSHVGYAADGVPIFVSKAKLFTSSYDQNGVFKAGSGNLDQCNGVVVNKKYYIYVLTESYPSLPLCWSGAPDPSFAKDAKIVRPPPQTAPSYGAIPPLMAHRQESLRRRGRK